MLPAEVMRQIRRLQLRARRAVQTLLGGEYHSVFKGTGLSFEEVREYQPGDDVRSIDWNVTARMGSPFIKRFVEERELTVILFIDASASLAFGTADQSKREVVSEIAALLTLCAAGNNGSDPMTMGSPAGAPSAIAVGAAGNDRIFTSRVLAGDKQFRAVPGSASTNGPATSLSVSPN